MSLRFCFFGDFDELLKIWLTASLDLLGHKEGFPSDIVIMADHPANILKLQEASALGTSENPIIVVATNPIPTLNERFEQQPWVRAVVLDNVFAFADATKLALTILGHFSTQTTA